MLFPNKKGAAALAWLLAVAFCVLIAITILPALKGTLLEVIHAIG